MRLRCEFSTPVSRNEEDDYVHHLVISVECYDEHCAQAYLVGKMAMDQILWSDALADGFPIFDICDNDSQGLHEAHVILTNGHDTFRPDLGIKEVTNHVMFLYGAVFHPAIHAFRQSILDTAFNLFGEDSVALMWLSQTTGWVLPVLYCFFDATTGVSEYEKEAEKLRRAWGLEAVSC